jgi:cysteine synthase A
VKKKAIKSIAVEPVHSPVLTAIRNGETPKPGPHKIQGIGAGFKPDVLDLDIVDEIATVSNDEAIEMAKRLHKEEGITAP